MKEVKGPLKSRYEAYDKELDKIFDVLASAELMLEEAKKGNIDFNFDYSGVIILYCKAVEIIEKEKCEKLESNKELTNIVKTLKEYIPKNKNGKPIPRSVAFPENDWTKKMINETLLGYNKYKNKEENIFHLKKAADKVADFKEYGISGDTYMYNTLLFLFHFEKNILNKESFDLFKSIYWLYNKDRNGSAHTDIKELKDAERVKKDILGENNPKDSIVYKLIYNLN